MRQEAPDPTVLFELTERLTLAHHPGWSWVLDDIDRGQGSKGLTLDIITGTVDGFGYPTYPYEGQMDAYHPGRPRPVHFYFPVPPASYNEESWTWWLQECIELTEKHERMEGFRIDGVPVYAPNHGPGWDPYLVVVVTTDEARRTSFRGTIKET